jgi:hypothetical protein
MALKIENLAVSETRKRIDADVTFTGTIFQDDYTASFRVLSPNPIEEGQEEIFLKKIHSLKDEWLKGKQHLQVGLGDRMSGYIINFEVTQSRLL